ncbi:hypothetical protein [Blastococcus sp. SYSU D00813]
MGAYLTDRPPVVQQWYKTRNRPLTGCTVLHTAESVMDTVGPDTGAEAVAEFIRGRTTPGSYHDLVDSDSWIPLVDLKHGAFHDGTGSNNWALSLSFACRTSDWRAMSLAKRAGFLHQGARAFANQQLYRRSIKAPLTRLRLISKAQSDRGESGCTYHGYRDPGRRSDPGVAAPNLFPIDEFFAACRAELARVMPDHPDAGGAVTPAPAAQEDDMPYKPDEIARFASDGVANRGIGPRPGNAKESMEAWEAWLDSAHYSYAAAQQIAGLRAAVDKLAGAVGSQQGIDPEALRTVIREEMAKVVEVQVSVTDRDT